MNAEFYEALALLEEEKGIPQEYMFEKIRDAIEKAVKRDKNVNPENVGVVFDKDKKIGFISLVNKGDLIDAPHTEVDKEYGGQGIAGKLVDKLVDYARENNKKIIPTCPYIKNKFEKDDKYKDVYFK